MQMSRRYFWMKFDKHLLLNECPDRFIGPSRGSALTQTSERHFCIYNTPSVFSVPCFNPASIRGTKSNLL